MVRSATTKKTSKATRLSSSFFRANARISRTMAIAMPTVGTWFNSRCTCARFMSVDVGDQPAGGRGGEPEEQRGQGQRTGACWQWSRRKGNRTDHARPEHLHVDYRQQHEQQLHVEDDL